MVYVWTGLAQGADLAYYGIPGIDVPANMGFQYLEPPEDNAFMRADEYDQLIADPTGFLYNVWLPRVAKPVRKTGEPVTEAHNLSFIKGGMAMMLYFMSFPGQIARLRRESGTASAIAGIFKAPMDILADKLRGYLGLVDDLMQQPQKVLAACEALMPYLCQVAKSGADPDKNVPIGYWMHRGCVPFVTPDQFNNIYWPTVKPIIEELWAAGHQTLFYAEGNWDHHLESFAELPDLSIVYHVDQGDIFKAHKTLGHKFCLSGGIPNFLLAFRSPEDVRAHCKQVIDGVARDGGYIMDASAIMQNDSRVDNVRAMTEFTREYGVYSDGHSTSGLPVHEDPSTPPRMSANCPHRTPALGRRAAWCRGRRSVPSWVISAATCSCCRTSGRTSIRWPIPISGSCCCRSDFSSPCSGSGGTRGTTWTVRPAVRWRRRASSVRLRRLGLAA